MAEEERQEELQYLPVIREKAQVVIANLFKEEEPPERIQQNIYRWSLSPLRVALFDGDTSHFEFTKEEMEFISGHSLNERERTLAIKFGFVPQFKTLEEFKARIPKTERVVSEANTGLIGFEDMHHFQDESDIRRAVESATLVPIPNLQIIKPDLEFEELVDPIFRHCLPKLAETLKHFDLRIKERWGSQLRGGQNILIISATRTVELQNLLRKLGYYAATMSTHTLGAAVDISSKLINPELAKYVWQFFEEALDNNEIVLVREIEEPFKIAHLSIPPKSYT